MGFNSAFKGLNDMAACEGTMMLRYEYAAVLLHTYKSYLDV